MNSIYTFQDLQMRVRMPLPFRLTVRLDGLISFAFFSKTNGVKIQLYLDKMRF